MRRQISPDELQGLFAAIGQAIWHLQYVEDALQTLLTMKVDIRTPGAVDASQAQQLLSKNRRHTLGTALRIAEERGALPDALLSRAKVFKEERDWLVHRSRQEDGDGLYTDAGRDQIFMRLNGFREEAIYLRDALLADIGDFITCHGLSLDKADALAKERIAHLRGER